MSFSQTVHFDIYTENILQYRKHYLDSIIDKYCNTDEPDYVIDIQTLKIVESSENEMKIPEFGKLNDYHCKPARKLIEEMMNLYTLSPGKLSRKNKKKRKHLLIQSNKRKVYSLRSKRKEKEQVPLKLDATTSSKSLTYKETVVDLTKISIMYEDVPIDEFSLDNAYKKLKHTNNTLSLPKTYSFKPGIDLAVENRKQIKGEPYFKQVNNGCSRLVSKGACEAECPYTYDSITFLKENKGDKNYAKRLQCSIFSQKQKNSHAENLDFNMLLKNNEAENNCVHIPESNIFEENMEEIRLKEENYSLSLTSSSTLLKECYSDSKGTELMNKSTTSPEIKRLKDKQSEISYTYDSVTSLKENKGKQKGQVHLKLDTTTGSKSLTFHKTLVRSTKYNRYKDVEIDPLSNSFKKKQENIICSLNVSKGAYEAKNSYDSTTSLKEKGDKNYAKRLQCSISSQKEKNSHAKNLDVNMPVKDTNEAENNFVHIPKSKVFEESMEEIKLKGENYSLSPTSLSTLSKECSSDSTSTELINKSTAPPEIKRLKNKQSEKLDVTNKQIVMKAACNTLKSKVCQISCIKLDCTKYKISREGSFILNSTEMSCSNDNPLHKNVNETENDSNWMPYAARKYFVYKT